MLMLNAPWWQSAMRPAPNPLSHCDQFKMFKSSNIPVLATRCSSYLQRGLKRGTPNVVIQNTLKAYKCVYKVDDPYSVTFLIRTPIFESYVVCWGSKNGYQKDMNLRELDYLLKEFDIHSSLNSQHHWDDLYDHSKGMRIFTMLMDKIFIGAPRIWGKWLLGSANHLVLIAYFIS